MFSPRFTHYLEVFGVPGSRFGELGCVFGGALRPIRAGFQNVSSGRLAGSSHHDCEQVVWRVKRAEQRQVELCGWASALSAYLAGEALTDRMEESSGATVDSSGEQWRVMDRGPLSTLAPENP